MNRNSLFVAALCAATMSTPALAGEIAGPPPTSNYSNDLLPLNGRSICMFSGLNDSPLGDPEAGDPGGITQSFGSFIGSSGFPVNELDPRSDFLSPGFGCNPNRGPDYHGG